MDSAKLVLEGLPEPMEPLPARACSLAKKGRLQRILFLNVNETANKLLQNGSKMQQVLKKVLFRPLLLKNLNLTTEIKTYQQDCSSESATYLKRPLSLREALLER